MAVGGGVWFGGVDVEEVAPVGLDLVRKARPPISGLTHGGKGREARCAPPLPFEFRKPWRATSWSIRCEM